MPRTLTDCQQREYAALYARAADLQAAIDARRKGGVKSATLSTAGNSQSFTALDIAELWAELRAVKTRMRQLLGTVSAPWASSSSVPSFAP